MEASDAARNGCGAVSARHRLGVSTGSNDGCGRSYRRGGCRCGGGWGRVGASPLISPYTSVNPYNLNPNIVGNAKIHCPF
jgi:hypothetical protein